MKRVNLTLQDFEQMADAVISKMERHLKVNARIGQRRIVLATKAELTPDEMLYIYVVIAETIAETVSKAICETTAQAVSLCNPELRTFRNN